MTLIGSGLSILMFHSFVWVILFTVAYATLTDVYCLRTMKESLEDPLNYLVPWNFSNSIEGFICNFTGVECWHPDENRVLNIRLSNMGLKGQFPRGIENCTTLTGLDLSGNHLYGSIPSNISRMLSFVTSLDLSSNNFSGVIPPSLANCSYLNVLKLDHNRLTGNIPLQLGLLVRIKTFNISNNLLSGQVPIFYNATYFSSECYANNSGLCGVPPNACQGPHQGHHPPDVRIIAGAAVGAVTIAAFVAVTIAAFVMAAKGKTRTFKFNKEPKASTLVYSAKEGD
ncbi:probably inactive leucine-rich repeat receptor-like protein kinase At5g48380 [Cornus florida]|uniref:probably inactive leucine-rich repeat receptor-like protein kinase At5g48380 n=1 Tax=Cornus florida TaxID=4283 RepID=UPI002898F75E|nr:probably inactive leucine-rich repeat receptor-like protein kinase At5g48380 [Cornus florida]